MLLIGELLTALRANDPDTFKRWLVGGIQDLGKPAVIELMADWMTPLLTQEDADRLVGWHLGGEPLMTSVSGLRLPETTQQPNKTQQNHQ
ncbi:hypothetical protein [Synechococcus sp. A15-127]|uniref:hypothetical protein n=1 Tax=Synechococcus sp. A15-127 TaxID=1050624 RepID=UPI0021036DFF|nr:hypothetical protein [Synechococcus sp. A15-127]